MACVAPGLYERTPEANVKYAAFVDPSGGSSDSMTLAIAHRDTDTVFLDCIREVRPPFSPEQVTAEFASVCKSYRVTRVMGDRYAGEWPREQFRKYGINYEVADRSKSDIYRDLLPLINSRQVELLDHSGLINQLVSLERRTARGGRDSIDHPPNMHDDCANAVAGSLLAAQSAHKRRITFSTYGTSDPRNHPLYEVGRNGELIPIDEEPRLRVRFVRLSEQEAPAVRGRVHCKLGS